MPAGRIAVSGLTRALAGARPSVIQARGGAVVARLGGPERILPVSVAALVLVASILSVAPATGTPAIGNTAGPGEAPRLAIGGVSGAYGLSDGELEVAPAEADAAGGFVELPPGVDPADAAALSELRARPDAGDPGDLRQETEAASADPQGPYLDDGTLLKPVAVDTTVADGSDKLREYEVRSGDTLTGIAVKFDVSMMTIWWANDLKAKDDLHVGQTLVIPPVSGLVIDVKDGDTLDSIAAATGASADEIVAYNGLEDRNLIIGQTLVIPGARGEGIPTPRPKPVQPNSTTRGNGGGNGGGGGNGSVRPPTQYNGGTFAWPVAGGSFSQYFHYGHDGVDIAADYGSEVRAAAAGTVVYAGWKSNGGGYQVWIAHGSGLYTTYNHMSAVSVGVGEHVGRGERVGRVGTSGWATGPHLHFEVWRGPVWDGGSRVNPLRYL
jgi:murein DD-endopeptidase MepM/ murein hydrolase activator NlpD